MHLRFLSKYSRAHYRSFCYSLYVLISPVKILGQTKRQLGKMVKCLSVQFVYKRLFSAVFLIAFMQSVNSLLLPKL